MTESAYDRVVAAFNTPHWNQHRETQEEVPDDNAD